MPKFLTVYEVAGHLRVHPMKFYEFLNEAKIKARKIGRSWVISEQNLDDFILGNKIKSKETKQKIAK